METLSTGLMSRFELLRTHAAEMAVGPRANERAQRTSRARRGSLRSKDARRADYQRLTSFPLAFRNVDDLTETPGLPA